MRSWQLGRIFETLGDLTDKHLDNEARFAELAEANKRADARIEKLEGSYELLETFVRGVREETHDYFAETDMKLAALAVVQAETAELLAGFIKETNGRFAETDKETNGRFAETDKRLAEFVSKQTGAFRFLNATARRPRREPEQRRRRREARNELDHRDHRRRHGDLYPVTIPDTAAFRPATGKEDA